eukprot:TRINITY_DN7592_c0_g1_i1.p1 TRINITY_DN7592_c0_g1~~TRINITY_DN7592_c0_g1_i1.p1  ORF type:complete len:1062 (+),score=112.05 TRINITY_DN7592_c0_g1_i1:3447-6632(+)
MATGSSTCNPGTPCYLLIQTLPRDGNLRCTVIDKFQNIGEMRFIPWDISPPIWVSDPKQEAHTIQFAISEIGSAQCVLGAPANVSVPLLSSSWVPPPLFANCSQSFERQGATVFNCTIVVNSSVQSTQVLCGIWDAMMNVQLTPKRLEYDGSPAIFLEEIRQLGDSVVVVSNEPGFTYCSSAAEPPSADFLISSAIATSCYARVPCPVRFVDITAGTRIWCTFVDQFDNVRPVGQTDSCVWQAWKWTEEPQQIDNKLLRVSLSETAIVYCAVSTGKPSAYQIFLGLQANGTPSTAKNSSNCRAGIACTIEIHANQNDTIWCTTPDGQIKPANGLHFDLTPPRWQITPVQGGDFASLFMQLDKYATVYCLPSASPQDSFETIIGSPMVLTTQCAPGYPCGLSLADLQAAFDQDTLCCVAQDNHGNVQHSSSCVTLSLKPPATPEMFQAPNSTLLLRFQQNSTVACSATLPASTAELWKTPQLLKTCIGLCKVSVWPTPNGTLWCSVADEHGNRGDLFGFPWDTYPPAWRNPLLQRVGQIVASVSESGQIHCVRGSISTAASVISNTGVTKQCLRQDDSSFQCVVPIQADSFSNPTFSCAVWDDLGNVQQTVMTVIFKTTAPQITAPPYQRNFSVVLSISDFGTAYCLARVSGDEMNATQVRALGFSSLHCSPLVPCEVELPWSTPPGSNILCTAEDDFGNLRRVEVAESLVFVDSLWKTPPGRVNCASALISTTINIYGNVSCVASPAMPSALQIKMGFESTGRPVSSKQKALAICQAQQACLISIDPGEAKLYCVVSVDDRLSQPVPAVWDLQWLSHPKQITGNTVEASVSLDCVLTCQVLAPLVERPRSQSICAAGALCLVTLPDVVSGSRVSCSAASVASDLTWAGPIWEEGHLDKEQHISCLITETCTVYCLASADMSLSAADLVAEALTRQTYFKCLAGTHCRSTFALGSLGACVAVSGNGMSRLFTFPAFPQEEKGQPQNKFNPALIIALASCVAAVLLLGFGAFIWCRMRKRSNVTAGYELPAIPNAAPAPRDDPFVGINEPGPCIVTPSSQCEQ